MISTRVRDADPEMIKVQKRHMNMMKYIFGFDCAGCGRKILLNRNGTFRKHPHGGPHCIMSGRKPTEYRRMERRLECLISELEAAP